MVESYNFCPHCKAEVQAESIFCHNCGANLQMPHRISSLQEISFKDSIETNYLKQYEKIAAQLSNFEGLDIQLQQQKDYHNNIFIELSKQKTENERLKQIADNELKDVENLKKRSWASIKARVKGDLDSMLAKEESEYLEAMHRIEASMKILKELERKLLTSEKEFEELKSIFEKKKELEFQLKELVYKAAEGIIDVEEDQIEMNLSDLSLKIDPLLVKKSRLQASLSHLTHSLDLLGVAKTEFELSENQTEKLVGINSMSDSIKTSKIAEIRDIVSSASQSLTQAHLLLSDLGEDSGIEEIEGGQFWNNFIKEFIKDLEQGTRTRRTEELINQGFVKTNQIISWINSQISKVNLDVEEIFAEIRIHQNALLKQRTLIFQKHLAKSQTNNKEE